MNSTSVGSLKLSLCPNQVHIWRIFLPIEIEIKTCLQKTLSQEELLRLEKFHFESDRERTLAARGGLRNVLAHYLNIVPNNVQFGYTKFGKPFLNHTTLNFNVSHANNCILIAVTDNMLVGIDVEYYKKVFDCLSIAREFFADKEYASLFGLDPNERLLAFYRCWTQKEAILKGIGMGLHIPLDGFDVGIAFAQNREILEVFKSVNDSKKNNSWYVSHINVGEDYIAALATSQKHNEVSLLDWKQNWGKCAFW